MATLTAQEQAIQRAQAATHLVKLHSNGADFHKYRQLSLDDMSMGVHWNLTQDMSSIGPLSDTKATLKRYFSGKGVEISAGKLASLARQLHMFQSLPIGSDVILGQGNCDGKVDSQSPTGHKVLYVAKVTTGCYFDNRDMWSGSGRGGAWKTQDELQQEKVGPFHRRKLSQIVMLPAGTSLSNPGAGIRATVANRPKGGWGVQHVDDQSSDEPPAATKPQHNYVGEPMGTMGYLRGYTSQIGRKKFQSLTEAMKACHQAGGGGVTMDTRTSRYSVRHSSTISQPQGEVHEISWLAKDFRSITKIGVRVVAKWPKFQERPNGGPWFSGKISRISFKKQTCSVQFDDGGVGKDLGLDQVMVAPHAPTDVGKKGPNSVKLGGDGQNHRHRNIEDVVASYTTPFAVFHLLEFKETVVRWTYDEEDYMVNLDTGVVFEVFDGECTMVGTRVPNTPTGELMYA